MSLTAATVRTLPTGPVPVPSAADLGMPAKFGQWRSMQAQAIWAIANTPARVPICAAPTGFGKSAVIVGLARFKNARTMIVTSTKALQAQYERDFGPIGLVSIKGMNAYPCRIQPGSKLRADKGPCLAGVKCSFKMGGCEYYDAVSAAMSSRLVVTNYALWLRLTPEALGKFDLLVLDEAHDAPDWLADYKSTKIWASDLRNLGYELPKKGSITLWSDWADWASMIGHDVEARLKHIYGSIQDTMARQFIALVPVHSMDESYELKVMQRKLATLTEVDDNWVAEYDPDGAWVKFDPIWPGRWGEQLMLKSTPKVVLISATVSPKTAHMLGIPQPSVNFQEWPSDFEVARRPVYHVPTVSMRYNMGPGEWTTMVRRIDEVIAGRLDRKGIVHSVSFQRAKQLLKDSKYGHLMVLNESMTTMDRIKEFRAAPAPRILVSPSVTTGWDFPYTDCEYQVIMKVPFADSRPLIQQAREAKDREWGIYQTMQVVVQMAGRGMRAKDDRCETFILDNNWNWFSARARPFTPLWFRAAMRLCQRVSPPPPPLTADSRL